MEDPGEHVPPQPDEAHSQLFFDLSLKDAPLDQLKHGITYDFMAHVEASVTLSVRANDPQVPLDRYGEKDYLISATKDAKVTLWLPPEGDYTVFARLNEDGEGLPVRDLEGALVAVRSDFQPTGSNGLQLIEILNAQREIEREMGTLTDLFVRLLGVAESMTERQETMMNILNRMRANEDSLEE